MAFRKLEPGEKPQPGDHIFAARRFHGFIPYEHHGIYCGEDRVVHYGDLKDSLREAVVRETDYASFHQEDDVFVRVGPDPDCLDPAHVTSLARLAIGSGKGEYSLHRNNCEHFATLCKTLLPESKQVQRVQGWLSKGVGAAATWTASWLARKAARRTGQVLLAAAVSNPAAALLVVGGVVCVVGAGLVIQNRMRAEAAPG